MEQLLAQTHPQWHSILKKALGCVSKSYLEDLKNDAEWLPGAKFLFAAFSLPRCEAKYILFGESPYPRQHSANGYAFWDGAVRALWSETGLSKEVNRATSLRNWMKMLLIARGDLPQQDSSQSAIAALDKSNYWQTAEQFFTSLITKKGFLLLNATLVYKQGEVPFHARQWQPFIECLLEQLLSYKTAVQLILFGRIAEQIPLKQNFSCLTAEHPYNISFITNRHVLDFFRPLDLLNCHG